MNLAAIPEAFYGQNAKPSRAKSGCQPLARAFRVFRGQNSAFSLWQKLSAGLASLA
jgi:hypothetical protein